jgi:ribosomal protein L13
MKTIAQKVSAQRTLKTDPTEYTIDGAGRTLGRVCSDAAQALLGKRSPQYVKNMVLPVSVNIINGAKIKISEKREATTLHWLSRWSSYAHDDRAQRQKRS